jgi:F-type H+-transporting ATPase subunit a
VHSPLEQFVIERLVPIQVVGHDISFTQSSLFMVLGVVAATTLMLGGMRRGAMVPGRWQNIPEMLYEFVYNLVDDNLGEEAKKYFPFVFSMFMLVLMGNLLGLIPYSFTYTSHIIVTGALALFVFGLATLIGLWKHKLHFFTLFLPAGLPLIMAPLIIPIEVISYLSRPVSLSVRLCANMMMGHTMLKLIAGFSAALIALGFGMGVVGILPFLVNIALTGLELLIAFIQAYVFAILTCIYLKDAIELH